jgi:M6 family metalloprotease-like protein
MGHEWTRRYALVVLLVAHALLMTGRLTGQSGPERPYATVTKLPSMLFEVWPADVNEDGVTDLVGGRAGGDLVVRIGRGDGTFGDERVIAAGLGMPVGVGDIDHDGVIDVVASAAPLGAPTTYILRGHGDGTFDAPIQPGIVLAAPVQVVDVNGDGLRDLVGLGSDTVRVYPGHGDFTFGVPTVLPTRSMVQTVIVSDLNGDGLIDVAAVTLKGRSIDVFLNQGAFTFTGFTIPLARQGLGLTAADMNGDGRIDLIATGGDLLGSDPPTWGSGFVFVLLGHGDGTFADPLVFETNKGPQTVVAGDFNGDGVPDIATGNLSSEPACDSPRQLWDSVSMLPGLGDGRLGPRASYALGDTDDALDIVTYRGAHHRLNTSDLNTDGRTDLIASPGAILLTVPPSENHDPIVDAGHPAEFPALEEAPLNGSAIDPDHDWLTFDWTDESGKHVGDLPQVCVSGYSGQHTFTLTATDGHGGVSAAAVTHTFGPVQPLPQGWAHQDIGAVSAAGSSSFDGATYTVTASGADIWGTSDEFHYVHSSIAGDFDISVRVASLQYVHDWTKAGLMLRDGLSPQARHAFVFATPSAVNGVAFQRRDAVGQETVHTSGPAVAPPVWLRLRREGVAISAFARSSENDAWTFIGTQTLSGLPPSVEVGLAVSSHADGTLATAVFDSLAVTAAPTLPDGWDSNDVGAVGASGAATFDGTTFAVRGSGADVWGVSDEFQYAHSLVAGDFDVSVRVTSLQYVHDWTKAGLMIRDGLSPQARHAFVFATPSAVNGVAFQRRDAVGGETVHTSGPAGGPPVWLRLLREGNAISAFARSSEDEPWVWIGTHLFTNLPTSVQLGLAVTSHADGTSATATFDHLVLAPIARTLPAGWTSRDIGAVAAQGWAAYDAGTFTVHGSGNDIWDASDEFHYAYVAVTGDFDVAARVVSLDAIHPWTKAGLMVRDGLSPQASHASVFVTPANGVAFQRRDFFSAGSLHTSGPAVGVPVWLRLRREGATVAAFARVANETWTLIGTQTFERLPDSVLVGLAVTSHADGTGATATFDNVGLTADTAASWASEDVGAPALGGSTTSDGATYTIRGSGADIWGTADAFRFVQQPLSGDGSVTARVAGLQGVDPWTKAGVMIRSSTDPSSAHAFMLVSASQGLAFQRRVQDGGVTTHTDGGAVAAPYWVRLTRTGNVISASASADGVTWRTVGSDTFPSMPANALAGLAVTSHDQASLATATFDYVQIQSSQTPFLSLTAPAPGGVLPGTTVTFEWSGSGDEFWLNVGTAPGGSDLYASASLGQAMRHTVARLPLNGAPVYVQLLRRIGTTIDALDVQYTAAIRRGLAVITDFRDRHLEDFTGAGMKNEEDVARQLRAMEDHWAFLSRGVERIRWEIIRIELPYNSPDSDPDPFHGDWVAFRNAAATEILKQVAIADYDVNHDGALDAAWLIVAHGGLDIESALGGSSRNLNVNMFVDGQASLSVTSGATGNFNHELGHLLGLRDTYGAYDTLHGLTLMSFSWPVPPPDFSAFERVALGWVAPQVITQTTRGVRLPSANDALAAVMIPTSRPDEYFLIEYRRRPDSGYGSSYFLPYNGLAVYHVLEGSNNNRNPPLVKLEPADGSNTYDGVLHLDDFVSPDNAALLRPMVVRSYYGDRPEVFRIENVAWPTDGGGGILFDIVVAAAVP